MFGVQLLALVFALFPIKSSKRSLLFAPIVFGSAVAVLMTYACGKISGDTEALSGGYQLGYYLVYAAVAMFLSAFLLNEAIRSRARSRVEIETLGLSS